MTAGMACVCAPHRQWPYDMLGASGEWCLSANDTRADCESVQFVSGLAPAAPSAAAVALPSAGLAPVEVILGVGINDCEALLTHVEMQTVWEMLQPMKPGSVLTCEPDVGNG